MRVLAITAIPIRIPPLTDNGVVAANATDPAADPAALDQNTALDPAAQQALDAVNDPWGGTPQPIDFASGFVEERGANPVPDAPSGPAGGGPGVPGTPVHGTPVTGASGAPGSPGGPGGSSGSGPGGSGAPPPAAPGLASSPGGGPAGEGVRINAVIVTGAVTPWGSDPQARRNPQCVCDGRDYCARADAVARRTASRKPAAQVVACHTRPETRAG